MASKKSPDDRAGDREDRDVGRDPLRIYLREISQFPRHSREEEAALGREIQLGDEEALKSLVRANLRFVVKIAKKYHAPGVALVDLINEGNIGLIEAARRFDPDRGTKFITYAVWWIRQAIMHALADSFGAVRLPLKRHQLAFQLGRRFQALTQELGRKPDAEELAEDMKLDPGVVRDILRATRVALPLEIQRRDSDDMESTISREEYGQTPATDPLETMGLVEGVEDLLSFLTDREEQIIRLHYGLGDTEPHTLQQIGDRYGLTRERIRQIEVRAKQKLRVQAQHKKLEEYLN